jgi:hypothetical protein
MKLNRTAEQWADTWPLCLSDLPHRLVEDAKSDIATLWDEVQRLRALVE